MNKPAILAVLVFSIAPVLGCGTVDPEPGEIEPPAPHELRICPKGMPCPVCVPTIDNPCEPSDPSGGGSVGAASSSGGEEPWGPDLLPIKTGTTYCVKSSATQLVINIQNAGTTDANANATRVEFFPGGVVDSYVPALASGELYQFTVPIPSACHGLACHFRIAADDSGSVVEYNETNNYVNNVSCP